MFQILGKLVSNIFMPFDNLKHPFFIMLAKYMKHKAGSIY